ncbi:MAG: ATP/GTP-binding protein [Theionarchaea archaeon]|nr:ATP/GTP-binding protein [Theionarchaea archaeon]
MQLKVLVTGAYNAGKTEFIRSISEIDPVSTERKITSSDGMGKEETTVAMDFGRITIDEDLVLYIFGTPGQERFDFMWELLSEGILGYVVIVDSKDVESLVHTKKMLEFFEPLDVPFVVAANKQDIQGALDVSEIRKKLNLTDGVQVLPCVASQRESVKEVLLTLLFEVLELLEE